MFQNVINALSSKIKDEFSSIPFMVFASLSREPLILAAMVTMPLVRDTGMTGLDGRAAKVSKAWAVSFKASANLQAKS